MLKPILNASIFSMKLLKLVVAIKGSIDVFQIVGSPLLKFQAGLGHFLNINGNVGRKHWKCLWNTVDRVVKVFPITRTFHRVNESLQIIHYSVKNYRKAIMRRDRSELADLTKSINFKRIGNIMLKSIKGCKEAWNELTVELLKEYIRSYDRVKIGAIAFEEACNKVGLLLGMLLQRVYLGFHRACFYFS